MYIYMCPRDEDTDRRLYQSGNASALDMRSGNSAAADIGNTESSKSLYVTIMELADDDSYQVRVRAGNFLFPYTLIGSGLCTFTGMI
jgi:hypothetical protein